MIFFLSNEGLFETIGLKEAWKISVKVDWSSHHFSQNCQSFSVCVSVITGPQFSHNIRTSIDTFSHEMLYSAHTGVRAHLARILHIVGTCVVYTFQETVMFGNIYGHCLDAFFTANYYAAGKLRLSNI